MSAGLPLLAERDLATPIAWRAGLPISGAHFLGEALSLAERLPAQGRPINLCKDRYLFALGLAAALLRGQTSQLLPNMMPALISELQAGGEAVYLLSDDPSQGTGGMPVCQVERAAGITPVDRVPLIAADLLAVCLLTSGSTGPPQPHAKQWGALVSNIRAEADRLAEILGLGSIAGLTLVATVPAQHSYGLESTVLLAMLGGAAFDAGRPFYAADIVDALASVPRPRALVTTPFHLKVLLAAGTAVPPTDLVLSATAPLSPALAARAEADLGGRLVEIYGCTEAGQVAARRTTEGELWTALGGLRLWREADGGPDGGERFMVEGGHVTCPTALADVLELQDERRFRLLGRANDLIHVAGKRSSLAHLNFHLNRIDGIDDGAFWMPDEEADGVTRPVALVVAPGLTAAQIVQALRAHLEPAFVPRRVIHVESLPREATGKLGAEALARCARAALAGDAEFEIADDHPAFAGHFPGQPVLPGVMLLSLVMQALDKKAHRTRLGPRLRIERVKFLAPVGPGARLQVRLREQGTGLAFEVRCGQTVVAQGQLGSGAPA